MCFLKNKRILITGIISNKSIAYGVAKSCREQGADLAFTYANERFENRVKEIAKEFDSKICIPCDVSDDRQIENLFEEISNSWDCLDGLVHSIGFAPRDSISGKFLNGLTRENFSIAHEISSYSFPAITKSLLPLLRDRRSSIITISYIGAEKYIPNYNIMGLAKASLESSIRYLAGDLGELNIRVNGISSGPIKTLAASGIKDFSSILNFVKNVNPLRKNVTIEDIGNTAAFLLSDMSSGITGEIIHVDAGFSAVAGITNNKNVI
ncbi:enoyl-[acyl-carrier protein] reductase I [Candidatus Kinetoplastibacterium blastocrithidii TCC012E]|uniref:Enoyl-[acyl-carrier-protein] reductase [NADH] n=1 Tax=Candidatus Kinetoplastidibacterium blastocrithidiae TCC012E TaxID=1208922 RepID=M1M4J5_9PROT|nr:SDR family oxidoreductase [Candidatus Kinetoplastibacterium blastocrithidii]AFZ83205.1 enoyl-[acyl-carrier protein] reductase I [Candidatus Kinetoplastibacterium blastocrithidii (ex Strigomonas culicis)]AGF50019.1 enoyl-[acyl-carrier protein] reductase I [Candidatus Kinetoplastibacterium blastocrithidii TCC012E]